MRTLHGFATCDKGEITLCEVDGRLHSMRSDYANIAAFTNAVDKHPKIQITRDMLHPLSSGDESRALFLPVHEPLSKQVAQMWYEQGFVEALRIIASEQRSNPLVRIIATWGLKFTDILSKIRPQVNKNNKILMTAVSQTRNWYNSPIRFIAWHPHCTKLAVAGSDDSVRIYSTESSLVPILKSKVQRGVSCVAWRPLSASEIAVACENCILIWTVDPNSVVTRPSAANSYILRRVNHSTITSLAWSPRGEYLVSTAASDSALLVWDVALDQTCMLKRTGNVGNTFLAWAQDGSKLLAASIGLVFRVWDCRSWNAERWNTTVGRVQSACWSPCGSIILFVTSEETVLYSLSFTSATTIFTHDVATSPRIATPIVDLSRVELPNGALVGGLVQAIDWDPKGRHLAVLFKDSESIAIFTTATTPVFQITPCCLVSGMPNETANAMAFQKNFPEGSCLTIGWSSGRLQHFPLIYSDASIQKSPSNVRRLETLDNSYNAYTSF